MSVTTKTLILGINKFSGKVKQVGLKKTLSLAIRKVYKLVGNEHIISEQQPKCEEVIQQGLPEAYQIITEGLKCNSSDSENNLAPLKHTMSFVWLVPFFSKGSGGHKNLFRFVKYLESFGCKCTIYIVKEFELGLTEKEIHEKICDYFENLKAEVRIYSATETYQADIVVCTAWITAYAALKFSANLKIYFVQDYEPLFYSKGSYWYLADNTYKFGFYHITLGPWLTKLLRENHHVDADSYNIRVENKLYYPREKIKNKDIQTLCNNDNITVCFYGRSVTPRRCFEIVVMALYLFSEKVENVNIITYGWNEIPTLPFKCHNLGTLPPEDLAELYSACDICIAPSATNLSLVAREVMACGCILMDLDVDNTSHDLIHLTNSYLVKPDPNSMYKGLMELYNDRKLLENLKQNSLEHISQLDDWGAQASRFYELVKNRVASLKN